MCDLKLVNINNLIKNKVYLNSCKLTQEQLTIGKMNPHCISFFCDINKNIYDCTNSLEYLLAYNKIKFNNLFEKPIIDAYRKQHNKSKQICYECIKSSYLNISLINDNDDISKYLTSNISKYLLMDEFKKQELVYKYDDIPYVVDYESSISRPNTTIHWGQLKMFLTTFLFLIKVIKEDDTIINIVYPGSAGGDNILILCDMFPNTRWYLIDPAKYHRKLYHHPQVIECRNEFFTDELALYYHNKLKGTKILFISDIRLTTDDDAVIRDQEMNAKWYSLIQPDYGFLKFRVPFDIVSGEYKYYNGTIYIQPYAPIHSTETRLLLIGKLEPKTYNIKEYTGKMFYFNQAMRPCYYKSIIKRHAYMDHCWDCVYYSYLVKNYISAFPQFNKLYGNMDITNLINNIIKIISSSNINRLEVKTSLIKKRIFD